MLAFPWASTKEVVLGLLLLILKIMIYSGTGTRTIDVLFVLKIQLSVWTTNNLTVQRLKRFKKNIFPWLCPTQVLCGTCNRSIGQTFSLLLPNGKDMQIRNRWYRWVLESKRNDECNGCRKEGAYGTAKEVEWRGTALLNRYGTVSAFSRLVC